MLAMKSVVNSAQWLNKKKKSKKPSKKVIETQQLKCRTQKQNQKAKELLESAANWMILLHPYTALSTRSEILQKVAKKYTEGKQKTQISVAESREKMCFAQKKILALAVYEWRRIIQVYYQTLAVSWPSDSALEFSTWVVGFDNFLRWYLTFFFCLAIAYCLHAFHCEHCEVLDLI